MSRRRRRVKVQLASLFVLGSLTLLLSPVGSSHQLHFSHHTEHQSIGDGELSQPKSYPRNSQHQVAVMDSNTILEQHQHLHLHPSSHIQSAHQHRHSIPSASQLCKQLPGHTSRHLKLCKLVGHSANANEALATGTARALAECRHQFANERWNCTHPHGDQHLLTSELALSVGNRESGFVHAITAAGIVHSIATACSVGNLSDCACDKTRTGPLPNQGENWKWGGCSNNIRHGIQYAKHLVELLDAVHEQDQARRQPAAQARHLLARRSLGAQPKWGHFCQRNSNLTQATHLELVRSLLARDSLERHHEFRLAMNMHNNKVGRLAVAEKMELKCRCHGLSGSCSLQTCWLVLPDFKLIGVHLREKYERSVHLPSAVNVNRLLPMMNRDEISAILGGSASTPAPVQHQQVAANSIADPATLAPPAAAAPTSAQELAGYQQDAAQQASRPPPAQLGLYERHRLLQLANASQPDAAREPPEPEIPAGSLAPMSQQQYQALLRDARLCGPANATGGHLSTRDLGGEREAAAPLSQRPGGAQLKFASHQLSALLHPTNRNDLIHLHKSPDYCEPDHLRGFAGVHSRVCSYEPATGARNCDRLCCGRGFKERVYTRRYQCDCKFVYCCDVVCGTCERNISVLVCN